MGTWWYASLISWTENGAGSELFQEEGTVGGPSMVGRSAELNEVQGGSATENTGDTSESTVMGMGDPSRNAKNCSLVMKCSAGGHIYKTGLIIAVVRIAYPWAGRIQFFQCLALAISGR